MADDDLKLGWQEGGSLILRDYVWHSPETIANLHAPYCVRYVGSDPTLYEIPDITWERLPGYGPGRIRVFFHHPGALLWAQMNLIP